MSVSESQNSITLKESSGYSIPVNAGRMILSDFLLDIRNASYLSLWRKWGDLDVSVPINGIPTWQRIIAAPEKGQKFWTTSAQEPFHIREIIGVRNPNIKT